MKVHCLFEQSGTFKNEFKKLGIDAIDYDIQNEFGQTDRVIDLFSQIRGGYNGEPSIFDEIEEDDLIIAFFPCTRFEAQILLWFRGDSYGDDKKSNEQKLERDLILHDELHQMYELITKLFLICIRKNLKLIFENPYSEQHYLTRYWCMKPTLIDRDRRKNGDYYKKPTQYWFLNIKPKYNLVFEALDYVKTATINKPVDFCEKKTARSMIHPQYANRFIREYILDA